MRARIWAALGLVLVLGCAAPEPKPTAAPGLRKVRITSPADLERLRATGVNIIVREKDYAVVRQDSTQVTALSETGLEILPMQERDLVQRLVRVHFSGREQLREITDMGLDVWTIEGDTLDARAFDSQLERLDSAGVAYRIVLQDASKLGGAKQ